MYPSFALFSQEIRTPLINFARKEIAKSEMHQEIRLRSPSHAAAGAGVAAAAAMGSSSQTSMGNLVGHLAQFPYLQRQLSQTCISVPVSTKFDNSKDPKFCFPS